ncbi:MAG: hypothetical protein IPI69_15705 [Bacteroidales bacterium]|nr:hypothetical protein [Bacteroidales bacterium]
MRDYTLNIAGYLIRLESQDDGPDLSPSPRFMQSIVRALDYDVLIRVHHGKLRPSEDAERLFVAPYVVEVKGYKVTKSDNFLERIQAERRSSFNNQFPRQSCQKATLKLNGPEGMGSLYRKCRKQYRSDGISSRRTYLYYLSAINADLMIHASGVSYNGRVTCSAGFGKGKTTMSLRWDNIGAQVIHDDRMIIRKTDGIYRMYNTPVYRNDVPRSAPVDRIFLISHGNENEMVQIREASAVSMVIANCIRIITVRI